MSGNIWHSKVLVMQCIEQPYKVTAGSLYGKKQTTCIFYPK